LVSCSACSSPLKMEAMCSSQTSVDIQLPDHLTKTERCLKNILCVQSKQNVNIYTFHIRSSLWHIFKLHKSAHHLPNIRDLMSQQT
jgi:hypothetical protein